jgi:hypothetical protein
MNRRGRARMKSRTFVAFSSADPLVCDIIVSACELAKTSDREITPWNRNDTSGQPIDRSVYGWVDGTDYFVADISEPNHNVTYEIGLALGADKPIRLIRAANKERKALEEIGLLHNLGHDDYASRDQLASILRRPLNVTRWPRPKRNRELPVYLIRSSRIHDLLRRTMSGVKKIAHLGFRDFNPQEIDRLTATEAFEQVAQSFGLIAIWHSSTEPEAFRQNQRAAFAVGVAKGLDVPFLLLAAADMRLPLDLDELATRWSIESDVDTLLRQFRDEVADEQQSYVDVRPTSARYLDIVHCGDPAAENEIDQLDNYFMETEQFRLTLSGELNIVLGRKGSGKTAIFLQARNRIRADKSNIVVDLAPEGFQLIKLKEFILTQLSHGARKEFIAAFWEYIVWLEIAYKLLEKDERPARYDPRLLERYARLENSYKQRVQGSGDFAVRLSDLAERILERYRRTVGGKENQQDISSKTLEIVYGSELRTIREEVLSYLKLKGLVCFLFDNLDRFRMPTGFTELDGLIIIGLIECLVDIRKHFSRADITFHWAIFLRSDVYEFVVRGMADYGKLASASVEWNDREMLLKMFQRRMLQGFGDRPPSWDEVWAGVSVPTVNGVPTLDFLLESSLMRPRYLIRLFELARRRAVTLEREKIDESDYTTSLEELGWQVLEDFDRELADVIPDAEELLFELAQLGRATSMSQLQHVIGKKLADRATIDAVIDVLIWTGCIGVLKAERAVYISDCGFKRPFLRALVQDESERCIVFHPTLASIFGSPTTAPARTSVSSRRRSSRDIEGQGSLF